MRGTGATSHCKRGGGTLRAEARACKISRLSVGEEMATKPSLATISIDQYVEALRQLPAEAFDDVPGMERWAKQHPVDAGSLERYLTWDPQHYTRNLIGHTDLYDLMAICWGVGQMSSIHNHKGQNCWMSVPMGRLVVQNYRVIFESVNEHRCEIVPTDTLEMNAMRPVGVNPEHPVHSVANPHEFCLLYTSDAADEEDSV